MDVLGNEMLYGDLNSDDKINFSGIKSGLILFPFNLTTKFRRQN